MDKFGYEERWVTQGLQVQPTIATTCVFAWNVQQYLVGTCNCLFGLPWVQVDVFAADTVVEGERRESLWTGDNVYPCILKVHLLHPPSLPSTSLLRQVNEVAD